MSGKSLCQCLLPPSRRQDTKYEHGKHIQEKLNTSKSEVTLKDNWMEKDPFFFCTINILSFLNKTCDSSENKRWFLFACYTLKHLQPKLKAVSSHFPQQKDCIPLLWLLPGFFLQTFHMTVLQSPFISQTFNKCAHKKLSHMHLHYAQRELYVNNLSPRIMHSTI